MGTMRKYLAIAVATLAMVGLIGCEPAPTPTITATPSTLTPGCETITTVTGKAAPVGSLKNVVIEIQKGSKWEAWKWFPTGASGESWRELRATIDTAGNYSVTYFRPQPGGATIRLRLRAMLKLTDPGVVSKSWYVTPPATACP